MTEMSEILEERARNKERVFSKRDKYEQQGFADKDFETHVGEHFVKFFLPDSVFAQQNLLSLGDKVMHGRFENFEQEQELTEKFYRIICQHLRINGSAINLSTVELVDLQCYAYIYWMELLYPLSLWSDIKVRKAIQNSNS